MGARSSRRAGRGSGQLARAETDHGAEFDRERVVDANGISPMVTWGTTPGMVVPVTEAVPEPTSDQDERALDYMGLEPGTPIQEIKLDRVFIGSCTNSRIGDLRAAAEVVNGHRVSADVYAMVVPGSPRSSSRPSGRASTRCSERGLRLARGGVLDVPRDEPGHRRTRRARRIDVEPQFRGTPGPRRALAPRVPQMAAAAAIEGHFVDIREWQS